MDFHLEITHKKHYYFYITSQKYGDITLYFIRRGGNIYAKLIRTTNPEIDEESDRRCVYKFQTGLTDIEYSAYEKKLTITKSDTIQCYSRCYFRLLFTINMGMAKVYDNEKLPFRIKYTFE